MLEVLVALEEPPSALDEVDDVLVGVGLGEAQHRHRVAHLGKAFGRRRAHRAGRAVGAHQFGKARLDLRVAQLQRVVLGVGDLGASFW